MVTIEEVLTKKTRKKFVDFPLKLYKDCPYYVPSLRADELALLNPKKNPSAKYCDSKFFLAYKNGRVVGRVAVIDHGLDEKKTGLKRLRFTRPDFIDDPEVADALMKTVEDAARRLGKDTVIGPIGYNDLDKEGLLVKGFDRVSTFETTYSYPYYSAHLERLGYGKEVDWNEFVYDVPKEVDERMERMAPKILERYNLRVLKCSKSKIARKYGAKMFDTLDKSYEPLYGTVPLMPEVVRATLKSFVFVARKELMCTVVDSADNVVATGIALPSIAEAVKKSGGRMTIPFAFRLFKAVRRPKTVDFALIGVVPEYQYKGLNAVVNAGIIGGVISLGSVKLLEGNPQLEINDKIADNLSPLNGKLARVRRLFIKKV